MTPIEALKELYAATRFINATAEIHEKLKQLADTVYSALQKPEDLNNG